MQPKERHQYYRQLVLDQLPRLLGLMDRNPASPTYGSFDRSFWHHRTTDFSSAALQMGAESLAFAYTLEGSPYLGQKKVLDWALAALSFTVTLYNSDGSFDEWYPGERGWAGPTGYVIASLCRSRELLKGHIPDELDSQIDQCTLRACRFLGLYEEPDVLANHQAMAVLAITKSLPFLPEHSHELEKIRDHLLHRLLMSFDQEGWSLEYDGADPGYQTATLSFLARVYREWSNPQIKSLVQPQLNFLKIFFYPDGDFGGSIGSRGTKNLFIFGFEYWSNLFGLAERMSQASTLALQNGHVPRPQDQEDHYLIYRLPEFFEVLSLSQERSSCTPEPLSFEEPPFEIKLKNSGYWVRKSTSQYWVANLKRGGVFKLFNVKAPSLIAESSGVHFESPEKKILSNQWSPPHLQVLWDPFPSILGSLCSVNQPRFNPIKLILFRLALILFSRSPRSARVLKKLIRGVLMTPKKGSKTLVRREFRAQGGKMVVADEVIFPRPIRKGWKHLLIAQFNSRHVPQSNYFAVNDLEGDFASTEIPEQVASWSHPHSIPWEP